MKKNFLLLFRNKHINERYIIYLDIFIMLFFYVVKALSYVDYKAVYANGDKYYLILTDRVYLFEKGNRTLLTIITFDSTQILSTENEYEMISIAKFNNIGTNILLVKYSLYFLTNYKINCYKLISDGQGILMQIIPYKYNSSYRYFFLQYIYNNNLYSVLYQISSTSSTCSIVLITQLIINNVSSDDFNCNIMQSSYGEVLTCFYKILNTKNITASSYNVDISSQTIEKITTLSKSTKTNGAKFIKSNIFESGTKAFVCFINDENNCDCSVYDIISNEWSNYKTYLNDCIPKRSTFIFDYYDITGDYFLYCQKSVERYSFVQFSNRFEIKIRINIDITERLVNKENIYFSNMVYDIKNISFIMNYEDGYYLYGNIIPEKDVSVPTTIITIPSTFINTFSSYLNEELVFSTLLSSTIPSTSLKTIPSTILKQSILSTDLTHLESTIQTTLNYSSINSIQTISSSLIETSIITITTITSSIIETLISTEPTLISSIKEISINSISTISSSFIETSIITSEILLSSVEEIQIEDKKSTTTPFLNDKEHMISDIKNKLANGDFDSLLNITDGEGGIIIKDNNNNIYEITTTDNQNKNKASNVSTILLGECENKLRSFYNISENEPLLIFKIDEYEEGLLTPIIEYEVYSSKTKKQLNLTICKDLKINVLLPASINEDEEYKHDSSDEYYNDICNVYTTDTGTDMTLDDRRKEFVNNNLSLCESNCEYKGYDSKIQKAECECEIKINIFSITEITINKDKLYKSFTNINNNINLNVLKCYRLLFNKEELKYNIGFYILLSIILATLALCIIFIFKGPKYFKDEINKIFPSNNNKIATKKIENYIINKVNENIIKNRYKIINEGNIIKKINEDNSSVRNFAAKKLIKKKNKAKKRKNMNNFNILKTSENQVDKSSCRKVLSNNKSTNQKHSLKENNLSILNNNSNKNIDSNINNNNRQMRLNDYEFNTLDYKSALKIDKRTYVEYYFSLLRKKQLLFFTFYTYDDYNPKIIKFILFLFSFSLYLTVDALFFGESTMHKIYQDKGKFNFIYQIPQILYSTCISSVIYIIITALSLSERNILALKKEAEINIIEKKIKLTLNCLKKKFIIFFGILLPILIIFWYYISCFCAVYKNTQIHLIKDTLISFGFYLTYPFLFKLIPGIFRIPSLKTPKQDKECLFKLSKVLQLI